MHRDPLYGDRAQPFQVAGSSPYQSPFKNVVQDSAPPSSSVAPSSSPTSRESWKDRARDDGSSWDKHVALPLVITGYVQAAFNVAVLLSILYGLYWFSCAIQQDVELKTEMYKRDVLSEIQTCAREYEANRCDPRERVPALQKGCEAWKNCMQRDPQVVARAKISAHTIAEILNSFIEPISYKTMLFFCLVLITVIVGSNVGFGIGRKSLQSLHQGGSELVVYEKKKV